MGDGRIETLESIIVEYAGPMGKFVVKKSMMDLGLDNGSITPDERNRLINTVLERAVYDQSRWGAIRKEILSAWGD